MAAAGDELADIDVFVQESSSPSPPIVAEAPSEAQEAPPSDHAAAVSKSDASLPRYFSSTASTVSILSGFTIL